MTKQPFKMMKTIGAVALIVMALLNYANFQFNYTKYSALIVTLMMLALGFQSYSEKKKIQFRYCFCHDCWPSDVIYFFR